MRQCNRNRRMRAWSVALLLAAAATITACGGSSSAHKDPPAASAAAVAATPGGAATTTTTSTATTATPGATGGTKAGATKSGGESAPISRASDFVTCMRANGIALPAPTKSGAGATLDFKGVDTSSRRYKRAVSACARKLLGKIETSKNKVRGVRVTHIHVKGIKLKSIHIGHVELKNLHVPSIKIAGTVTAPPVKVNAPAPNLGGQSGGEVPTHP